MRNHKEIKQQTPEWHEIKWGKIGGTLSAGLLVNSDTLLIDILSQRIEEFEPSEGFSNDAMDRGNEMEPFAIEYLEQYTGLKFENTGWLQCEENELLGISPDGITSDETVCCEAKALSRKEHTRIIVRNEIPSDKINQLVHYFVVNPKLETLYFLCFRPESKNHFLEVLTRESVIDLGWKKEIEIEVIGKKGVPIKPRIEKIVDAKPISEWCEILRKKADELLKQIQIEEQKLNF